ncbi:MAG: ABC transporter substrate-binding protein [Lachnospiraceae bacterium]|nr:ABC transporter substrate-binding protein [Lachnospiraceae bacterium]
MFKIKNIKKILLLTITLTLPAVFSGCGNNSKAANTKDSAGLETIKIAAPSQDGTPVENAMLAQKLGYIDEELEKAGYKAEYMGFAQAGPAINEAFAAGETDYAFYNEFPAIMAKSNGIDIKIIATATEDYNYAIIAGKDSGIKTAKDFTDKKVIATTGTVLYKYFADICQDNNIDISSIEFVNAQADAVSVLASGQADALVTAYSSALQIEEKGIGTIIENTTTNEDERTGIMLAASSDTLSSKEDSAIALIKALKRAADFAQENPDKVYGYLTTESNTEELVKKIYSYDTSFSYFQPFFTDNYRNHVKNQYLFAKENGLLGSDVNLNELLDETYLNKIQ